MQEEEKEQPVEIPPASLKPDILRAIVEEFVLRSGTDYGAVEVALETKVQQVLKQIQSGDVRIMFDATSETVSLLPKRR